MEKEKEFEGKADTSSQYEMNRCVESQSKEQVMRRLKRAALPLALLVGVIILALIFK